MTVDEYAPWLARWAAIEPKYCRLVSDDPKWPVYALHSSPDEFRLIGSGTCAEDVFMKGELLAILCDAVEARELHMSLKVDPYWQYRTTEDRFSARIWSSQIEINPAWAGSNDDLASAALKAYVAFAEELEKEQA